MQKMILILLCAATWCAAQEQAGKSTDDKAAGQAGKRSGATSSAETTAVLDTTAGKLNCTLFPKQAPKTVANFIGLASGSKDWTDPRNGQKKHGVPYYNGTIFHRVIPNFMI